MWGLFTVECCWCGGGARPQRRVPGPSLGFDSTPSSVGVGLHFDAGGTTVAPVVHSDARPAPTLAFDLTPLGFGFVYIMVLLFVF